MRAYLDLLNEGEQEKTSTLQDLINEVTKLKNHQFNNEDSTLKTQKWLRDKIRNLRTNLENARVKQTITHKKWAELYQPIHKFLTDVIYSRTELQTNQDFQNKKDELCNTLLETLQREIDTEKSLKQQISSIKQLSEEASQNDGEEFFKKLRSIFSGYNIIFTILTDAKFKPNPDEDNNLLLLTFLNKVLKLRELYKKHIVSPVGKIIFKETFIAEAKELLEMIANLAGQIVTKMEPLIK